MGNLQVSRQSALDARSKQRGVLVINALDALSLSLLEDQGLELEELWIVLEVINVLVSFYHVFD